MSESSVTLRAPQSELRYSKVVSYGASRGSRVMFNDDIIAPMDSSDEWIQRRTGIVSRTYAAPEQSLLDMAVAAGAEALTNSGLNPADIDGVIFSSCTNPYQVPSLGPLIAARLGITSKPASYDMASACSGYTVAVAQADALIRANLATNILVVAADRMTDVLDPTDRSTAPLFADGAGASVITYSATPQISKTIWGSDGTKHDAFWMTSTYTESWAQDGKAPTMRQEGQTIYRWAVYEMGKIGKQVIAEAGIDIADIAAFIPHQANVRIIDELAKQIGFNPETIVARDVITTGNTSAATIPLATHSLLRDHPELSGKYALQLGFGAGVAYAGQVVRLP